jgi:pyruvate/2-oxoglutarate dehydrogenase complex dihydrolipoamide dehydrogenase (E3) component/uncharacterized membrane protein YdjX (TVP38/TMEM64 family)
MKTNTSYPVVKWSALALFFGLILGLFVLLSPHMDFDNLKAQRNILATYADQHRAEAMLVFFLGYVGATALSLPFAAALSLLAGGLFGWGAGTVLVSFASTMGATISFLIARFFFRDWVQGRFADSLREANARFARDGALYLLSLRLVPAFPFFAVNWIASLFPIRAATFYWTSQLGMLPATMVYVNAGTRLGELESLQGILSPGLIAALSLLGLVPLVSRWTVGFYLKARPLGKFKKPAAFDYNVVVIGGGSAGLVTSYLGAALKAKVALIEKHKMGGDCLNTGCVPSKALLRSAKVAQLARKADALGFEKIDCQFSFPEIMERVQRIIRTIEPNDSPERYRSLGVDCISGTAVIRSPYEVEVGDRLLRTRAIVVATGASPRVPSLPGLASIPFYTSETIWNLRQLPKNLLVLGGGPIGCELAQAFGRLGAPVTLVERGQRLLPREDEMASAEIEKVLRGEGVAVHTLTSAKEIVRRGNDNILLCATPQGSREIAFDQILLCLGRKPNIHGFGLEELGLVAPGSETLPVNERLQTALPNITACGDCVGPYQFTHMAAHQAYYALSNALLYPWSEWVPFPWRRHFVVNNTVVPWATFTEPEVATVGETEATALAKGLVFDQTVFHLHHLDRAICDDETRGFVKVLTHRGSAKILGATVVASSAGETITEFITALRHNIGLDQLLATIHIYPTYSDANKLAAGAWRRAHPPGRLLRWVQAFHRWRRRE